MTRPIHIGMIRGHLMVQIIVEDKLDSRKDSPQIDIIYVSRAQKEVLNAIIRVLSESLYLSEHLTKSLLHKSIKIILCGYEYGNCYKFEQRFNSKERKMLYEKIRDQFILLLGNMMPITPEQRQIMMGINDYFIPLIEEHYSLEQFQ